MIKLFTETPPSHLTKMGVHKWRQIAIASLILKYVDTIEPIRNIIPESLSSVDGRPSIKKFQQVLAQKFNREKYLTDLAYQSGLWSELSKGFSSKTLNGLYRWLEMFALICIGEDICWKDDLQTSQGPVIEPVYKLMRYTDEAGRVTAQEVRLI